MAKTIKGDGEEGSATTRTRTNATTLNISCAQLVSLYADGDHEALLVAHANHGGPKAKRKRSNKQLRGPMGALKITHNATPTAREFALVPARPEGLHKRLPNHPRPLAGTRAKTWGVVGGSPRICGCGVSGRVGFCRPKLLNFVVG